MVEFALVLPVMILLLLAAVDFGRLFFTYIQVTNAAREAAAFAAEDPAVGQATIAGRAGQEAKTQSQRGEGTLSVDAPVCQTVAVPPVTVSCATAQATNTGTGNQVVVNVSRPFNFFTPIIGNMFGTLTMRASAASPVHNLAAGAGPTPAPTPTPDPCALLADFTFDQDKWNKPVDFTDQSTPPSSSGCKVTGWQWDFGDPNVSKPADNVSTLQNPSHDYGKSHNGESFVVTLKVSRSGSTDTFSQPVVTVEK